MLTMRGAILFDLDETLVVEEPAAVAAFEATANVAARRYGLDASELALAARARARDLWYSTPVHDMPERRNQFLGRSLVSLRGVRAEHTMVA